jgi:hypothetical protein
MGDRLGVDLEGEPLFLSGRVLDVNGQAISNALIEVWQPAGNFRGQFRTDGDGNKRSLDLQPQQIRIRDRSIDCCLLWQVWASLAKFQVSASR